MITKNFTPPFLMVALIFILVSCRNLIGGESSANNNSIDTYPSTPLKIDTGNPFLFDLEWPSDSISLTYGVNNGYRVYNINDHSVRETETPECLNHDVWMIDCKQDFDRNAYSIPAEINDLDIMFSPSGKWVLYRIYTPDEHGPTPEPRNENYPDPLSRPPTQDVYEIWIAKHEGLPVQVGDIPLCMYRSPLWTSDESRVVLPRAVGISPCGDYSAWLIDLEHGDLQPLIPNDVYTTESIATTMSPDGTQLLFSGAFNYGSENLFSELFTIDLNTFETKQLDTPAYSRGIAWLTRNQILIHYANESDPQFLGPGLFDLKSNAVIPLAEQLDEPGYCIRDYAVSPDANWLAFVGSDQCEKSDSNNSNWSRELWLVDLSSLLSNSR